MDDLSKEAPNDLDKLRATKMRAEAAELLVKAAQLDNAYEAMMPVVERLAIRRCGADPLRGENIKFHIELADGEVVEAMSQILKVDGGRETEAYRCLQQCSAALYTLSRTLQPASVFNI